MNQQLPLPEPPTDPATQAFTEMRNTLATLECAIKEMAGERKALVFPDYSETLEEIAEHIAANAEQLAKWADKPALKLTPEALGNAITKAGTAARAEDHAALDRAIKALGQSEQALTGALATARTAQEQEKRLKRVSLNCVVAGMVIWSVFPGMIIRAMPDSWQLPERMAAWSIGGDPWEAGQRMLSFAYRERWQWHRAIDDVSASGQRALTECLQIASSADKAANCKVMLIPLKPKT